MKYMGTFLLLAAAFSGGYVLRPAIDPIEEKGRVTSIGGIFFKAEDPKALREWYAAHLGLGIDEYGSNFEWRHADDPQQKGFTLWAPFHSATKYFGPSTKDFMINYRVIHLDALLEQLKQEGIHPVDSIDQQSYGRFVHIMDPEGNKIELWEPDDEEYEKIVGGRTK